MKKTNGILKAPVLALCALVIGSTSSFAANTTKEVARDGHAALRCAKATPPDLLLLDLNMPNLDGWTTFARVDHACPLVPVIIITARPHQYKEAVQLGVDAFMEKPLDFPVLLRAIRKLTSEPEKRHTQRVTDRDFVTWLLQPKLSKHA